MSFPIPKIKSFKSRPPIIFGKFLISDSYHKNIAPLTIPESEFYDVFYEIYPQTSFTELLQWIFFFEKKGYPINVKKLASAYHFYWGDHENNLKQSFPLWPEEFIHWSIIKKAHSGDLRSLSLCGQDSQVDFKDSFWSLLKSFNKAQLSLSEGKKILEWIIDLFAQGESAETLTFESKKTSLLPDYPSKKNWIKRLYHLRYAKSTQEDYKKIKFTKETAWPPGVQVQFARKGDQSGFESRIFISSSSSSKVQDDISKSLRKIQEFFNLS